MQLIESKIRSAKKRSKKQIQALAKDARELYGNIESPDGCLKNAAKQAKGIRERKREVQENLGKAKSQVLKLAEKRWEKIKEQAEDAGENLDEQTKQLVEEAKSRAIREAEESVETYAKAARAAINLIGNNLDVVLRGVLFVLLRRTKTSLKNLMESMLKARRQMNDIRSAADIFQNSEGVLPSGGFEDLPSADEALDELKAAIRDLRLVRQIYVSERVVEPVPTREAKSNLTEASRILASNKAIRSVRDILENTDVDTGIDVSVDDSLRDGISVDVSGSIQDASITGQARQEVEERIRTLEDAKASIAKLPAVFARMAVQYQMLRTWSDLARLLPEHLASMDTTAKLINTEERLAEVQKKAYEVYQETQQLNGGAEAIKKRAELSATAQKAVKELEQILAVSSVSPERGEQIYSAAMDMYSRPFFTSDEFVTKVEQLEINAKFMDEAQDVASSVGFATDAIDQVTSTTGTVREIHRRCKRLLNDMEGRPALFNSIVDLLAQAGISKPVEVIIRGKVPRQVKEIIAAGGVAIDALASGEDCPEVNTSKITPGDQEQIYASAVDRARQNKIALSGPTKAMSDSEKLSKVQQFGLKGSNLI